MATKNISAIFHLCFPLLLFALISSKIHSQPVQNFVNYFDKNQKQKKSEGKFVNGLEEGEWKFWYECQKCKPDEQGKIKEISNYSNGKFNGRVTIFYENGGRQNEGFFKRNLPDSIYTEWYPCSACGDGKDGNLKITGYYDEKVKTGLWTYYFPQPSKKYKEVMFLNGQSKLVNSWDISGNQNVINGAGKHVEYYENSKTISEECEYSDSIRSGAFAAWYKNGNKKEEGKYLRGMKEGSWTFWHPNGKLFKKSTYSQWELEGEFIQYFQNEKPEASGNYLKGKKEGKWVMHRENGNLDYEGEFKEDLQHGFWIYYYSSGEKESTGYFKEGKRDSLWIFLYKSGDKWKEGFFVNDLKNGKWTTWFEKKENGNPGHVLQEGNYLNGKEDGLWTSWYEDGKKKDEGFYKNGLMEGSWNGWYPNGNKNYEGKILNGLKEESWAFWFPDGKLRERGKYLKGKKQGFWEFYHETGGLESAGNFMKEKPDGKWTYYFACPECKTGEKGQKMREEYLKNGIAEGKATVWYPGGAIQSETDFKKGKPNGEWKQFNKNGMITMDRLYKEGKIVKDKMEIK